MAEVAPTLDIYRSAKLLVDQHGDEARGGAVNAAAVAALLFLTISYARYKRRLKIRCNLAEINIRLRR